MIRARNTPVCNCEVIAGAQPVLVDIAGPELTITCAVCRRPLRWAASIAQMLRADALPMTLTTVEITEEGSDGRPVQTGGWFELTLRTGVTV